jgi:hypothetical protein
VKITVPVTALFATISITAACSTDSASTAPPNAPGATATATAPGTAAATAAPPVAQAPALPLPAGAVQLELAEIMDASSGAPRVAARVLLPVGWRGQGGVKWASQPCQDPATFAWHAVAPDGITRVELFPTEIWQGSLTVRSDCQPGYMRNAREYLTAYVKRHYPGAQPGEYKPRIDFLDAQKEYLQARIAMVNNSGLGMRAWADAGELLFTAQENGQEISGIVQAAAMFYESHQTNPMGGAPLASIVGGTNATFGARAPKGQLDTKLVEAVRKSIKLDGQWALDLMKLNNQLGEIQVQGVKDRAAIIVAGGAAITAATIEANNMATAGYADRSAASDRMQRERVEAIRGVETYNDPIAGGTVQLDNTYANAWRVSGSNSYILTNDPNFNPGAFNIEARQLKAVP